MSIEIPTIHAPTASPSALSIIQSFLQEQVESGTKFKPNETIQVGWIQLKVSTSKAGLTLVAPCFSSNSKKLTDDCSDIINLFAKQRYIADSFKADYGWCSCKQYAVVIKEIGSCKDWFMNRIEPGKPNDSGWFIGAKDTLLDANNPEHLETISLWEIFCQRPQLGDFFLLPFNWQVILQSCPVVLYDCTIVEPLPGSLFERMYKN